MLAFLIYCVGAVDMVDTIVETSDDEKTVTFIKPDSFHNQAVHLFYCQGNQGDKEWCQVSLSTYI